MSNVATASARFPEQPAKRIGALSDEAELRQLIAQLGHDLRQPLSAMESTAYFLSMHIPDSDQRSHTQLEKLRGMAEQMDWMLQDAMHFAQASAGTPVILDLFEAITETVAHCALPDLHLEMQGSSALVLFDPVQVRHLLRSLLHLANPAQLVADGARIELRTSSEQTASALAVASVERIARLGGACFESDGGVFSVVMPAV